MKLPSLSIRWAYVAAALVLGCQPDIGDSCSTNAQCSLTGDRLCDPTSPGGYCTIFNCLPGKCPDEAVCVAFYSKLSSLCSQPVSDQRFERSFCMKKCSSSSDCRASEGYDCVQTLTDGKEVSAIVLEEGAAAATMVCMVRPVAPKPTLETNPQICAAPPLVSDAGSDGVSPGTDGSSEAGAGRDGATTDASEAGATVDAGRDAGIHDARVGQ